MTSTLVSLATYGLPSWTKTHSTSSTARSSSNTSKVSKLCSIISAAGPDRGGLIIIKVPDRDSVYGFITRLTPYWFHVFYKRYIMSKPNAGKHGFGPYPTVHDRTISRRHFQEYLSKHSIDQFEEMGFGKLPAMQVLFSRIVHLVSFGSLAWDHTNLLYLVQLPGSPSTTDG